MPIASSMMSKTRERMKSALVCLAHLPPARRWDSSPLLSRITLVPGSGNFPEGTPHRVTLDMGAQCLTFTEALRRVEQTMLKFNEAYRKSQLWDDWEWVG